jgi:hypothetical protein
MSNDCGNIGRRFTRAVVSSKRQKFEASLRGIPLKAESQAARERPISFTAAMARAILDGRKTQTRRVIRSPDDEDCCPLGAPGDLLWVREPWGYAAQFFDVNADPSGEIVYAADGRAPGTRRAWRPPSYMPRACSRLRLEIIGVESQPLQQLTTADARAEGYVEDTLWNDPRQWFTHLWDRLYAEQGFGWQTNPRVWVITFRTL